ncbi:excinuclease ABC subunit C [Acetomicrobium thermoterrenum DSM 13490]|uniref:Excinuclease ABC subunit C n=2 Tax=Acetomicrobium TaxID=49894 RepID=A0A1H3GNQ7_9BACT|nr:excinuclease ABC subunit UvrC [Acetomicrobium thermoterrenum]SDY03969.1 excinuclease ABC subunit C [Acetomicrobium thermoterrenum DSM 13490]
MGKYKMPRKKEVEQSVPTYLSEKVRNLPNRPGVYIFHGEEDKILYVGKAKSLKKRVSSYFRHNGFASPRLRKLVELIRDISFIRTETEAEALVVEARLIKHYQPFFNIELKMGERYPYIKITRDPYPKVEITRHKADDGSTYIGPYTRVKELRQVLRLMERYFPLRNCSLNLKEAPVQSRPCLRYNMGKCLGPCAGLCTQREYQELVDDVILFLRGQTSALVESLRKKMNEAVESLAFEKAAFYRDAIRAIWRLSRQQISFALRDPLDKEIWKALERLQEVLDIASPLWRIEGCDISHLSGRETYGVFVVFEQGMPNPSLYRRYVIKTVEGIDDFRSVEEIVRRRYSSLVEKNMPLPQLLLVDGGALQLSFALKALNELGIENIYAVALAKEEEELYLPDSRRPLKLPLDDPGLNLLRRIRDEAHRFALSSHNNKFNKRYSRSALEDIPGVGKRRAAALLAAFGSVSHIASKTPEELEKVDNIGPRLARHILMYLKGDNDNESIGKKTT